jgi:DNA-binding transcriptional ArsR family regulator
MSRLTYRDLAERIYSDHAGDPGWNGYAQLTPLSAVVRRYGTSHPTLRKALAVLYETGRALKRSAQCIYLVDPRQYSGLDDIPEAVDPDQKLHKILREQILGGYYKSRVQLPKIGYFVLTYSVSPNTVCHTLKRLESEGLIYKSGRKWFCGSPRKLLSQGHDVNFRDSYSGSAEVVLIIARNFNHYCYISNEPMYRTYMETCLRELYFNGISTEVCYMEEGYHPHAGIDAIISHIDSLGRRHRGTLLIGSEKSFAPERVAALLRKGKLTVWFDINRLSQTGPFAELLRDRRLIVSLTNEEDAVRLVLEKLHQLGHRRVAIPVFRHLAEHPYSREWVARRIDLIRGLSRELDCGLEIRTVAHDEPFFFYKPYSHLIQNPDYIEESPVEIGREQYARILRGRTPLFREVLSGFRATAIIGLNDYMGREYVVWCYWAGVAVPQTLSVISFDNRVDADALRLTSVDFGFDYSGHQTAHRFIGTLPMRKRTTISIPSRPWLVERGSIGPAPKPQG